jgi:hypothetical protein
MNVPLLQLIKKRGVFNAPTQLMLGFIPWYALFMLPDSYQYCAQRARKKPQAKNSCIAMHNHSNGVHEKVIAEIHRFEDCWWK